MQTAVGIGATVGAALAAAVGQRAIRSDVLLGSALLFALGALAFAASPNLPAALAVLVLVGPLINFTFFVNQTMLTLRTPDALRGRVWSIHMMTWSLPLLATLPVGWAADLIGAPLAVGFCGAVLTALTLAAWLRSAPVRQLDSQPAI